MKRFSTESDSANIDSSFVNPVSKFTEEEYDLLYTIAHLGFHIAGLSVYEARGLLRLDVFDEDENSNREEGELNDNHSFIYPNPTDGIVRIYSTSAFNGNVTIKIYNVLGDEIVNGIEAMSDGTLKLQLNLAAGIYFCKVINDGKQLAGGKIVIVR